MVSHLINRHSILRLPPVVGVTTSSVATSSSDGVQLWVNIMVPECWVSAVCNRTVIIIIILSAIYDGEDAESDDSDSTYQSHQVDCPLRKCRVLFAPRFRHLLLKSAPRPVIGHRPHSYHDVTFQRLRLHSDFTIGIFACCLPRRNFLTAHLDDAFKYSWTYSFLSAGDDVCCRAISDASCCMSHPSSHYMTYICALWQIITG